MPLGGATASQQRLAEWVWQGDYLKRYKQTRNGLLGSDFSSRLAPWLANGSLSARSVAATIRAYETQRVANENTIGCYLSCYGGTTSNSLGKIQALYSGLKAQREALILQQVPHPIHDSGMNGAQEHADLEFVTNLLPSKSPRTSSHGMDE